VILGPGFYFPRKGSWQNGVSGDRWPGKMQGLRRVLEACTAQVLEMQEGKSVPVKEGKCLGCESCREVCEEKAIRVMSLQVDLS